jgi:protein SCO1/2
MKRFLLPGFILGLLSLLCGCSPAQPPGATSPAPGSPVDANITNYTVRGVVIGLGEDGKSVKVKHEEIPGYMMAMTMPFEARPTNELTGLMRGDQIEFRMRVTETDGWIDQIRILGTTKTEPTNAVNDIKVIPDVPELKAGDLVPNYTYTNELGRVIHLADYRGQALAITFVFTRCPFPTFCPRMTEQFGKVSKILKSAPDAPSNWRLLSLSFDPEFDTAATLLAYGQRHQYDPARWSLATGSFNQIERLTGHFGLYFGRNVPIAQQNHNLRTVVLDTQGRVHEIFVGNEWTAEELATSLRAAAAVK